MVSRRGSLLLQTCTHPGGWRGGGLPSTASKLGLGCRNPRVCHIWALGGGAVVSVVGVLALGPLLGVGQKGTYMAWTRGSDHALEAC